jgi:hypothetical protein
MVRRLQDLGEAMTYRHLETHEFNPFGGALVLGGTVAVIVGLTVTPWAGNHRSSGTASDLHRFLSGSQLLLAGPALPDAFFSWLSWGLLVITVALGTLAICPIQGNASFALRIFAFLAGSAAMAISFIALVIAVRWIAKVSSEFGDDGGPLSLSQSARFVVEHAGAGAWLTFGGFVLIAIGGLCGPLNR